MNEVNKISGKRKIGKADPVESRLVDGESVLKNARIHWGIYWKAGVIFFIGFLIGVLLAWELGILLMAVGGLAAFYAAAKKAILLLCLTNKRVLARYGILQVDVVDIHFDKIESLELERMLPGYLMGYSNVVIMGTGNRMIVIPYVANGPEVRRAYNETVLSEKKD